MSLIEEEMWTQAQRNDDVKKQGQDGPLWAKDRGCRRGQACDTFILDFKAPELSESKFVLFKPPGLWYFVVAAWAHWCDHHRHNHHRRQQHVHSNYFDHR